MISYRKRDKEAELRAERIRWKGSSQIKSQATLNIDEHLKRMTEQASTLDKRLNRHDESIRSWHSKWDDLPPADVHRKFSSKGRFR